MEDFVNSAPIFLLLFVGWSFGYGINLKKWYGWAQVFCGFILGMVFFNESIPMGILFAMVMIIGGHYMWKIRHP